MSVFNPETFLTQTITDSLETKFTPIPTGEYLGAINDVKMRTTDKGHIILDVIWDVILSDEIKTSLGLDKPTIRQSIFLDLDANGKITSGTNKNVDLGRVREAVNQNQAGQAWGPLMLKGAGPAKLMITQRFDEKDPTKIYNDVKMVARV